MTNQTGWPELLQEGSIWKAWSLIDQPSKVCTSALMCAFKDCYLPELLEPRNVAKAMHSDTASALEQNEKRLAFPVRVVHPESVGDVVASLKWAHKHKFPVTVKTSGNHYAGAGTLWSTLNVNTRLLPAYSSETIHKCAKADGFDGSIVGLSCRLALARGKTRIVHVGCGKVWDALLRSVVDFNDDPPNVNGKKYMALSGRAGTVAPAGGWLVSGGNLGDKGNEVKRDGS
ncbi:hypothetical protein ACHAWF_003791 [Thalassiosira exigua]